MGFGGEDAPWGSVEQDGPQPRTTAMPRGVWFPPGRARRAVLPCCALPVDAIAGEAAVGAEAVAPYEHGTG